MIVALPPKPSTSSRRKLGTVTSMPVGRCDRSDDLSARRETGGMRRCALIGMGVLVL